MSVKLLVVLQNSYAKGNLQQGKYNPATWRKEYLSSRTGIMLKRALPEGWAVRYTNANPKVGDNPKSVLEPDLRHLKKRFREVRPDILLACGRLPQRACMETWDGPMIGIPHPACRVLTNSLLDHAHDRLRQWSRHRHFVQVNLSQIEGAIVVEGSYTIVEK